MSDHATSPLYLALFTGVFSGAILTWAVFYGRPFLIGTWQKKVRQRSDALTGELRQLKLAKTKLAEFIIDEQSFHSRPENEKSIDCERKRIADELHDDTLQRIATVRLRLEQASYWLVKKELINELKALGEELNQVMKSIHFLIWDLSQPEFSEKKLTVLLREMFKKVEKIAHYKIIFSCPDEQEEFFINAATKQVIYRMTQEVLQNFMKHSLGFSQSISITWENGLKIVMKDDGHGIWRDRVEGEGTVSLQRRAKMIGATVTVRANTGRGACVIVQLKK